MKIRSERQPEIAAQRDHLFAAERFHQNFTKLVEKRSQIEKKTSEIHQEMEKIYREGSNQILADKKIEMSKLKKEMNQLDQIWDEWDDLTELQIHRMRDELFNEIWLKFPNGFEEQKNLWGEFKSSLIQIAELEKVLQKVLKVLETLQAILRTRASIKGLGLLQYIFGVSPNAIIEKKLIYTHQLIGSIESEIEKAVKHCKNSNLQSVYQKVWETLLRIKKQCEGVWGFRHIDTNIAQETINLKGLIESLQSCFKEKQDKSRELKGRLDDWLAEF